MYIQFNNQTSGATSYTWDFGDGHTSTGTNPHHEFTQEGCFDVTLTAYSTAGCSTTIVIPDMICVFPSPIADFVSDRYEISNVMNTVNFINQSQNATSYEWYFGDEDGYSTNENPQYTYDPSIIRNYAVILVATNEEGCTDTARVVLEMKREIVFYVPNTFTPDGDQFNNVFKPVFVEGYDLHDFNMTIFDRWGEIIFETNDPEVGWDGVYKLTGKIVQDGTYVWMINIKVTDIDNRISKTEHVTLLR